MVFYELVSPGGNHMTDNDYLMRRINNKLKAEVFSYRLQYLLWPVATQKEINNVSKVHIFQNL